ncbi:uncharacterized protein LOC8056197 [Sorghum bicolor]|uniref:uncharacterized protein LOC8056197 n=1 Tax=Sorghum bicolor TaxID=4558 RepID=UPI000B426967|nr:uncharacterized protein LOC8056197 [Sorghum bicolor]|eukprot:XP_002462312.2 uncharacterized protein LOC8056197 [Sorghum bicolor]
MEAPRLCPASMSQERPQATGRICPPPCLLLLLRLVFCVEDRAILCPDCDDPIHSANDLTAKHTRFLLVGAKLSAELVDQAPASPNDDDDACGRDTGAAAEPDAVPALGAQGSCAAKASALESGSVGALGFDKAPASVVAVPTQGFVREMSWNSDSDSDVFVRERFFRLACRPVQACSPLA